MFFCSNQKTFICLGRHLRPPGELEPRGNRQKFFASFFQKRRPYFLLLLAASIALLASAPTDGNFWNTDAPRHAMDGMFMRDFMAAAPIHAPVQWAQAYYFRHPALAIAYYPPFFAVVLAVFYTVFGASQFVAQSAVGCFTFLLGVSSFQVARRLMGDWAALGAALLVIATPLTALWGRQVMLDVPAYALSIAALWCFVRHVETYSYAWLAAAACVMVLAIYTKYNTGFVLPALAAGWFAARRAPPWHDRKLGLIIVASAIALIPAMLLVAKFGSANAQSIGGRAGDVPATRLAAWLYYPQSLPNQIGIALVPIGMAGLAALGLRAREKGGWLAICLLVWLVTGYAVFAIIPIREQRHDMAVLFPLLLGGPYALARWLGQFGDAAALALGSVVACLGIAAHEPRVDGYGDIAAYVAAHTPPHGVVLFDGYRDGNLVFDLMTIAKRPDIAVVRADKLLLSVRFGERERRGVGQSALTGDDMTRLIARIQPDLVIVQPGFWGDLRDMALLEAAIKPPAYRRLRHIAITGDLSAQDGTGVDIYAPAAAPTAPRGVIELRMPDFNASFRGIAGQ
jgi:hypothetical protein